MPVRRRGWRLPVPMAGRTPVCLTFETSFRYSGNITVCSGWLRGGQPIPAIQSPMEVHMEPQPPRDPSALLRAIDELQAQLTEIRQQLSSLQQSPFWGYYQPPVQSQDQIGEHVLITEGKEQYYGRNKDNPPIVPHRTLLKCVRCEYQWVPHAQRPKKCPNCKAPWWFPPKWRWHQSQSQSQ